MSPVWEVDGYECSSGDSEVDAGVGRGAVGDEGSSLNVSRSIMRFCRGFCRGLDDGLGVCARM